MVQLQNAADLIPVTPLEKCSETFWEAVQQCPALEWVAAYHSSRVEERLTGAVPIANTSPGTRALRPRVSELEKKTGQPPEPIPSKPSRGGKKGYRARERERERERENHNLFKSDR